MLNYKPFILVVLVIAALSALFYLPRYTIFGHDLRRVNILSDIQQRDADGNIIAELAADSTDGIVVQHFDSTAVIITHEAHIDSVPEGMTPIEDFGPANDDGKCVMDAFYAALSKASERPVRIAYFGDSYIEGDILTEDLRQFYQDTYGGKGVGFVDITSPIAGFRQTIISKASANWIIHNTNDEKSHGFKPSLQGINGRYFIPSGNAWAEFTCQKRKYGNNLSEAELATVFFTPGTGLQLSVSKNSEEPALLFSDNGTPTLVEEVRHLREMHIDTTYLSPDSTGHSEQKFDTTYITRDVHTNVGIQELSSIRTTHISGPLHKFRVNISNGESSRFYGIALDGKTGVAVDNLSMRGSNGWYIQKIPAETLKSFAHHRPYDLIILHFGLNVATNNQVNYSGYTKKMANTIEHIKANFPGAAILVVSIADRDEKDIDGNMRTMRGVRELVHYQRKMAADTHVAFWNLYEAMGGDGSLARLVDKKMANLDYTHINFSGGKHLARLLFNVLENGKKNYEKESAK